MNRIKSGKRMRSRSKQILQKNALIFVCLTLLFSPFGTALGGNIAQVHAESATEVTSAAELNEIRNTPYGSYILAADIDLSELEDWKTIGDQENPFSGKFNWNGHEITGIKQATIESYEGLFGVISEDANLVDKETVFFADEEANEDSGETKDLEIPADPDELEEPDEKEAETEGEGMDDEEVAPTEEGESVEGFEETADDTEAKDEEESGSDSSASEEEVVDQTPNIQPFKKGTKTEEEAMDDEEEIAPREVDSVGGFEETADDTEAKDEEESGSDSSASKEKVVDQTLNIQPVSPSDFQTFGNVENDYEWEDNSEGVTITGYSGSETDLTIPTQLDGKDVTEIGYSAFTRGDLTGVVIPEGVTRIANVAFRENNLTSVELPSSVTHIGNQAFIYNDLTSVEIPGGGNIY